MRGRNYRNPWLLILMILIGIVAGGIAGDILKAFAPILGYSKSIGLAPATINLSVLTITFGFQIRMSLASIIGLILAVLTYFRL